MTPPPWIGGIAPSKDLDPFILLIYQLTIKDGVDGDLIGACRDGCASARLSLWKLFGLGHLPAMRALATITPPLLARTLVLNVPIGLVCGWPFWRQGLEAAIIAHFLADVVYHVGGTLLLPWWIPANRI